VADIRNDFIRTLFATAEPADGPLIAREAAALEKQGLAWLREEQRFDGEAKASWYADMRYRGQSFEIEVPLPDAAVRKGDTAAIAEAFHAAHEGIYDFCDRDSLAQIVNLRLVMAGSPPRPAMQPPPRAEGKLVPEQVLRVFFDGGWHEVPLYRRAALAAGQRFAGPCVVAQDDSTACIPPGFDATVDEMGNIILDLAE
jgi:N-methylhydantoinase A